MPDSQNTYSHESSSTLTAISQSPILWGGAFTIGFYLAIPYLPRFQDLAQRYFCSHPLEYATTYLFFVGMAVLFFKAIAVGTEKAALRFEIFENIDQTDRNFGAELKHRIQSLPAQFQNSWFITRMRDVANYLRPGQSQETVEEHLRYLADRAADKLHESYALVRTVTWAVPILGFLGTVIGITMAIAHISLTELQNSLSEVVGGLSVSFDTTALALTLSLVLVFASFLVERLEQQILSEVEDLGIEEVAYRMNSREAEPTSPLIKAEQQAADELLSQTRKMVDAQMRLWSEALDRTRQTWVESLHSQESQLQQAITKSLEQTLNSWQSELRTGTNQLSEQQGELQKQTELLVQLLNREESLASVSNRLNENLAAITASNKLEEVLHNLNAAVHLLTSKSLNRVA
ncbi:MAG: MotA/TolQ/ExbB proton channel family protein [Planctomycetaceae bacterium]|nr:MotA/TolQ/ExbB proton channel family protein [Planctomycetaceae bacterium]